MQTRNRENNKKILIFNVNWLGDVLFSTAALRALRRAHPAAHIAVVVHPRAKEILEGNPNIDEIIIFDEKESQKHLLSKFQFAAKLKKKGFDTAYLFHRSFTRLMLVALANIPNRIGYKAKKRSFLFLTKRIPLPKSDIHRVDYYLNILRSCDIACMDKTYEFFPDALAREKIQAFLEKENINKDDFLVVINPGGNWLLKRWLPERFSELSNNLIEQYGAKIVISGSEKDFSLAQAISAKMKNKPIIACGKTSLKELGALLERSNLFISADSGPMHIATALKVPVIALFGPTSPQITGPIGKGKIKVLYKDIGCKIPCYNVKCKDNRCMQAIRVPEVLEAVKEIIK